MHFIFQFLSGAFRSRAAAKLYFHVNRACRNYVLARRPRRLASADGSGSGSGCGHGADGGEFITGKSPPSAAAHGACPHIYTLIRLYQFRAGVHACPSCTREVCGIRARNATTTTTTTTTTAPHGWDMSAMRICGACTPRACALCFVVPTCLYVGVLVRVCVCVYGVRYIKHRHPPEHRF